MRMRAFRRRAFAQVEDEYEPVKSPYGSYADQHRLRASDVL